MVGQLPNGANRSITPWPRRRRVAGMQQLGGAWANHGHAQQMALTTTMRALPVYPSAKSFLGSHNDIADFGYRSPIR